MTKDQEQELLRAAKQVLTPEKYEEFFANISSRAQEVKESDWEILTHASSQDPHPYSSYKLGKCTQEEKQRYWKYLDKHIKLTVASGITMKSGKAKPLSEIVSLMCDRTYARVDKLKRQVMFSTSDGVRPIGDKGAMAWNGFQVIDLDLKNPELAKTLKRELFDALKKEHWFLATTVSSSGSGLHIWTKIKVPENISFSQLQILYALNFRHKYSSVYINIEKKHPEFTSDQIISFMDMAMFKPQQGVFIPGQVPEINTAFLDNELIFESLHNPERKYSDEEWVTAPAMLETFTKWEWFANSEKSEDDVNYASITATGDYTLNGIRVHYKHEQRWKLANTLCSIYGYEKGLELLRAVVSEDVPTSELRADMLTANNNNKPVSLWAIRMLNSAHGFNIKCQGKDTYISKSGVRVDKSNIYDLYQRSLDNCVKLSMSSTQFLSDISEEIKENLGHMTLLEAGAGYGKTEMIKKLGGKVLLVLPFTSIIESKFNDSTEWECFFQNRSVSKADLEKYDKLCMTADKFSQLKIMDVNYSYFDYVVIDESHLLFLSDYRPIMSKVVDNIAHCACKVILMTGTPSGETLFFPKIKHIQVTKEETRDKTFAVYFGNMKTDTRLQMADAISNSIMEGKKILFPTNAGSLVYNTLIADIDRFLFYKGFPRSIRSVYYKKSNEGCQEMDKITFEKTISDLDFVACTSYLSVGVDICDKFDFEIYFDKLIIGQDIEQYANRIRNNNLHINMYLPKVDDKGKPIEYDFVVPFVMKINKSDLELARNSVQMCNVSALRANGEYKYNPIIHSVLRSYKYIMYSNDIGKYYVDETAFKLNTFEDQYRSYAAQLPVVMQAMARYGYACSSTDQFAFTVTEELVEEIEALNKSTRKSKHEEDTRLTFEFLNALNHNNIDFMLEALNGRFKIKKTPEMAKPFDLVGEELHLKAPDLFQKNMPVVKTLYKFYDFETIIAIFDYCMSDKNYQINYSMLRRVTKLISIEYNNRKGRIDIPIMRFMDDVKNWVTESSSRTKDEIASFLKECTVKYIRSAGEFLLANVNLIDKTYDMIEEIFKVLVTKSSKAKKNKKGVKKYDLVQNKLLWTEKTNYSQLYGNPNTKIFFWGDVLPVMEKEEPEEQIETLELSSQVQEDNFTVEDLDPSVISSDFDYFKYEQDNHIIQDFFTKQLDEVMEDNTIKTLENTQTVEVKSHNVVPTLFSDVV